MQDEVNYIPVREKTVGVTYLIDLGVVPDQRLERREFPVVNEAVQLEIDRQRRLFGEN